MERRQRQGESTDVPAGFERYTKVGTINTLIEHPVCDCENVLTDDSGLSL